MNLNKLFLAGRLTRDPELRYTPNNTPVCNLGLATNRRWKNQQGEQQEEATFVDLTAFGKTAETINKYMKKGRPLFVEGRLKLDQWQDRDGNNRSKLEVVVESFQFLESGQQEDAPQGRQKPASRQGRAKPAPAQAGNHHPVEDDSIPF